jgi:hypothetical protein
MINRALQEGRYDGDMLLKDYTVNLHAYMSERDAAKLRSWVRPPVRPSLRGGLHAVWEEPLYAHETPLSSCNSTTCGPSCWTLMAIRRTSTVSASTSHASSQLVSHPQPPRHGVVDG